MIDRRREIKYSIGIHARACHSGESADGERERGREQNNLICYKPHSRQRAASAGFILNRQKTRGFPRLRALIQEGFGDHTHTHTHRFLHTPHCLNKHFTFKMNWYSCSTWRRCFKCFTCCKFYTRSDSFSRTVVLILVSVGICVGDIPGISVKTPIRTSSFSDVTSWFTSRIITLLETQSTYENEFPF